MLGRMRGVNITTPKAVQSICKVGGYGTMY